MTTRLLHGDCRDVLPTLADASVHCVVTSPPYYALRDYGTGTWEGGDSACGHVETLVTKLRRDHSGDFFYGTRGEQASTKAVARQFRDLCGKCGARRIDRQIGLEATPDEYLATMVAVFREVRRVLRPDGCMFLNCGDAYTNKQLQMMPARLALALQADGWWLRSDIIWSKPNPMPESCRDRCTSAHEHVFMLTKSARYYFNADAIREERTQDEDARTFRGDCYVAGEPGKRGIVGNKRIKVPGGWDRGEGAHGTIHRDGRTSAEYQEAVVASGRNCRNVWTIATEAFPDAHFATMPSALVARCIKAGCPPGGIVLDPFAGVFTVPMVADRLQRDAIGIELSEAYCAIARNRMAADAGMFIDLDEQGSEPCQRAESWDQSMVLIASGALPKNGSQLLLFPSLTADAISGPGLFPPTVMAK